MAHWLVKSEPSSWSFQQQMDAGPEGTFWNGVRNHAAKRSLMSMAVGEEVFFYHSSTDRSIVGIVRVIRPYYPDPSDESGTFGMVDVSAVRPLARPVSLDEIKTNPSLKDMILVKNSRLSVQPVTDAEWAEILVMAEGAASSPS